MMATLLLKLTVVLLFSLVALACAPKLAPNIRHLVCTSTVIVSLLLPLLLCTDAVPAGFNLVVSASPLTQQTEHTFWNLKSIWLLGTAILLLRFFLGVLYLSWKIRRGVHAGDIRYCSVSCPAAWGWFRPVILMPTAAAEWPHEQSSLAIAQERAHIERGDIWTSTLAAFAEAVYWFHPLIWWITKVMRQEQEFACDERVLEQGYNCFHYAELLVASARQANSHRVGWGMAGRMNGGKMKIRVSRILNWQFLRGKSRTKPWPAALACTGCLLFGSLVAPAASDRHVYKIGGDVTTPTVIEKHEPQYTKEARDAKVQGMALLEVTITEAGTPKDIHVLKSLDSGLDQKAVEAVALWRFQPATKAGQPVSVTANIEVQFRLVDDPNQAR
jgi:TonB family protein